MTVLSVCRYKVPESTTSDIETQAPHTQNKLQERKVTCFRDFGVRKFVFVLSLSVDHFANT